MAKLPSIPYVSWRDGRPRFNPNHMVRALGFKAMDLKHADGRWMTRGEALDWAEKRAAEVEAIREAAKAKKKRKVFVPKAPPAATPVASIYTVAHLVDDWLLSPLFPRPVARGLPQPPRGEGQKSYRTMQDYRQKMRTLEAHDHELYHSAVAALDQPILVGLHEDIWQKRGLPTANAVLRVLSAAISWGMRRGKVRKSINPAFRLGKPGSKPRLRFASRAELEALVAAADAIGRPEMGDMIILGVWTGQRQADRLALLHEAVLVDRGRRVFRQQKTGARVVIPESPELKARLAGSRVRRIRAGIVDRHVVMNEQSWRPFTANWYRHLWDDVRSAAVDGVPDAEATATRNEALRRAGERPENEPVWKLPPVPSLKGFRDQDLRDTAVTWMGLAGLTIPEICSITGHSEASAYQIMKHYLALHPDMASAGMKKLVAWYETDDRSEEMWK
ncbi:hypothetical protein [Pleomorphomonas koreensis]|uniref:hypothetical protein n=1 Tax=Pleomorphomonas koreensis TaxID=257440 RepID=UPI000420BFD3|nr:hypothetical protein [Pleomorphomonas koreensis]